jgi:hypothetical protein
MEPNPYEAPRESGYDQTIVNSQAVEPVVEPPTWVVVLVWTTTVALAGIIFGQLFLSIAGD